MSDSLQPHGLQCARPPCPSPTPRVYPNPCPLSWWRHPTISSSVIPFSSCPQSFPASGSFQMSQFFTSGCQSIGVSVSTSLLPMNTQDWSPLGWTGWISVQSYQMRINPALSHLTAGRTKSDQTRDCLWKPLCFWFTCLSTKRMYVFKDQYSFKLRRQVQESQLVTCPQSLDHVLPICEPSWTRLPSRATLVLARGLQWSRRACLPSIWQDTGALALH